MPTHTEPLALLTYMCTFCAQVLLLLWMLTSYVVDGFADVGTMVGARLLGAGRFDEFQTLTKRLVRSPLLPMSALQRGGFTIGVSLRFLVNLDISWKEVGQGTIKNWN